MTPSEAELEGFDYWEQPPFEPSKLRGRRSVEAETVTALFAPKVDAESEAVDA